MNSVSIVFSSDETSVPQKIVHALENSSLKGYYQTHILPQEQISISEIKKIHDQGNWLKVTNFNDFSVEQLEHEMNETLQDDETSYIYSCDQTTERKKYTSVEAVEFFLRRFDQTELERVLIRTKFFSSSAEEWFDLLYLGSLTVISGKKQKTTNPKSDFLTKKTKTSLLNLKKYFLNFSWLDYFRYGLFDKVEFLFPEVKDSTDGLSVIVPSYRGEKELQKFLKSFFTSNLNFPHELIVIENGMGFDHTKDVVESYPSDKLKFFRIEKNIGYAGAVRFGSMVSTKKNILILCNDNELEVNFLHDYYHFSKDFFNQHPDYSAIMVETILPEKKEKFFRADLNVFFRNAYWKDQDYFSSTKEVFFPGGNGAILRKSVFPEIFHPSYFTYQEDVALGFECRIRGYKVAHNPFLKLQNFDGGITKTTSYSTKFYTERNRWLNFLTFFNLGTKILFFPLWATDFFVSLIFGSGRAAKVNAFWFLLAFFPSIRELGKGRKKNKTVSDWFLVSRLAWKWKYKTK